MDKYDATKNVGEYFNFLKREGKIVIIEEKEVTGYGNYSSEIKRSFRDSYIYYHFTDDKKIYKAYFPDGDYIEPNNYYELENKFQEYVQYMKKVGEYYFEDTDIPRHEIDQKKKKIYFGKEFIYIADRFKVYDKFFCKEDAVVLYDNSLLMTKKKVYILADNIIIEADRKNCQIIDGRQREFYSSARATVHALSGFNEKYVFFKCNKSFFIFDKKDCLKNPVFKIKLETISYNHTNNSDCILIAEKSRVHAIHSISTLKGVSIDTISFSEQITSIEVIKNYAIINNKTLILIDDDKSKSEKERVTQYKIENIPDLKYFGDSQLSVENFVKVDGLWFCDAGLFKIQREKALLKEFLIEHSEKVLIETKISNPEDLNTLNNGLISEKKGAKFYSENEELEILYSLKDRRSDDPIFKCIFINLDMAKKILDKGVLHLYVKEDLIGRIIGKKGANINSVKDRLRKKGLKVNRIEVHPI